MIVYHGTKSTFVDDVIDGKIADNIDDAFVKYLGRHTSQNEFRSWENSMQYMCHVVSDNSIPSTAIIAIEYQIPLTSKRIDFIISGEDECRNENVVIIELKQWSSARVTSKPGVVTTHFQRGEAETAHPSYQAWSYVNTLRNFNQTIQENNIQLHACAYLHNYIPDNVITNEIYQAYIDRAPVFLKNDARKLTEYISRFVKYGPKKDVVWEIENGKLRPSKQLVDVLDSMFRGNQEFTLLDEQKVAYETAFQLAANASSDKKQVYIVEGGPGTGKSVLAINLLVNLTKKGLASIYVTKNAAPRAVYEAKLTGCMSLSTIHNMFKGSGCFIDTPSNTFDTIIVDEAHRLNEKSGLYGNQGNNQIQEIINASKCSVFFVDDRQRIHIKDIGSSKSIENIALSLGANVVKGKLASQFRCNGSDGYLSWLDNTLQIAETANIKLTSESFDFRIFDNPNDLFNEIKKKNEKNNKSRIVAGYCWPWNSKKNLIENDIVIKEFGFAKKWNLSSDGSKWIIAKDSINEIGCIHTCQGLELDYVGVIVGNDLTFDGEKVLTDVTQHPASDQAMKGLKGLLKKDYSKACQEADALIKNTYRTLMSRGMKGCYVYFCDKALAKHFQEQINEVGNAPEIIPQESVVRIEETVNDDVKYVDFLPLYSIRAACGYFGDGENIEELGWVEVQGLGRLNRNMYVVQAKGHSMEPRINDGDFCVFKANDFGTRQGKIVLVEHQGVFDYENQGAFSIKEYASRKKFNEFGEWSHEEIQLKPYNHEYNTIYISEEDAGSFRVVGTFVGVIKP